jgi:hypothetical protein
MEDSKKALIQGVSCGCHPSNGKFALWFRAQVKDSNRNATVVIPSGAVALFVEAFDVPSLNALNGRLINVMVDQATGVVRYVGPAPKD